MTALTLDATRAHRMLIAVLGNDIVVSEPLVAVLVDHELDIAHPVVTDLVDTGRARLDTAVSTHVHGDVYRLPRTMDPGDTITAVSRSLDEPRSNIIGWFAARSRGDTRTGHPRLVGRPDTPVAYRGPGIRLGVRHPHPVPPDKPARHRTHEQRPPSERTHPVPTASTRNTRRDVVVIGHGLIRRRTGGAS
ncbi:hypothetical protein [Umezawaea sp. Da 62-37]|uniref:hypothetical protein n=1 Tax=Umezawaea sp. Da 62-37 TaxID=3075927 RepID=UPI0028F72318|nr:hypothetical protein [Umezawaea sp. Da 62-37]WNV85026.1 hypothetical protein RM788_43920 [Umezawaea sp. Da 62-37]